MSVSNGQPGNQTTFNNAFMSRTVDTSTTGKVDLQNAQPESGASVINSQREVNSLNAYTGRPSGSAYDATPTWTNNQVGLNTNSLKARAEALTERFDATTGHTHNGTDSPKISAANLLNINQYFAEFLTFDSLAVTGGSIVVTSLFAAKTPGGNSTTAGVLTTAPDNKIHLIDQDTGTGFEDAQGQKVYGRLTESTGAWTLTFYTNEAGVETAYSFGSAVDMTAFYREVFTLATRPTIPADMGNIGSLDLTADVVDASATQRGVVSTGTQSFAGAKTFTGALNVDGATRLATSLNGFLKASSGAVSASSTVNLASEVTGTLPIANGGSGATTSQGLQDASSPMTTKGDIEVHNGTNVIRLGVGIDGQTIVADSAQASGVKWADSAAGGLKTTTFAFSHADLAGSVASETFTAFTPTSVGTILLNIAVKTTTAFNDGATMKIKVNGIDVLVAFNLTTAVGATQFASVAINHIPEWSTAWTAQIEVISGSSDTNNITQGALTVYTSVSEVI
jgi:hypothetical protein